LFLQSLKDLFDSYNRKKGEIGKIKEYYDLPH
jgi:hypothetical protein